MKGFYVRDAFAVGGLAILAAVTACSSSASEGGASGDTVLPVDCRNRPNDDPSCSSSAPVGTGPDLQDGFESPGFVDGDRIIVPVVGGNTLYSLYAVDLHTRVRTVLSGTYHDPVKGNITVGSGPVFATQGLRNTAKGPDGYYAIGFDKDHDTNEDLFLYRIDPVSGDRTVAIDFQAPAAACAAKSGIQLHPPIAVIFSAEEQTHLWPTFAPDGTLYLPIEGYGMDDKGKLDPTYNLSGVAAFKDGKCRIVTLDDSTDKDDVGTGYTLAHRGGAVSFASLRYANGALYAVPVEKLVFRIDPATGNREVVSSSSTINGVVGSGPGIHRGYMDISPDGTIWTAGGNLWESMITAIDPRTGNRTGYDFSKVGWGGTARPLFGVHATKPLVFIGNNKGVVAFEYTTGNANVIAQ